MRLAARALAVTVTSLLLVPALPGVSFAAAAPMRVSGAPMPGDSVNTLGSTVSTTFDTAVAATSTYTVTGPTGFSCTATAPAGKVLSCSPQKVGASYPEGTYTVQYTANNSDTPPVGTTGNYTFTVDTTAPVAPTGLTIAPSPYNIQSGASKVTVSGVSESGTDTVLVTLAGSDNASTTQKVVLNGDRTFSVQFPVPSAEGTMKATAASTDRAGNVGAAATATATKDTVAPTVVSSTPADNGSEQSKTVSGTTTTFNGYSATASEPLDPSSTLLILDSTGSAVRTSAATFSTDKKSISVTPTSELQNTQTYTAALTLVDVNGNRTTVNRTFRIDNDKPAAPAITSSPAANKKTATAYVVSGTGEPGATLVLTVTDSAPVNPASRSYTTTVAVDGTWTTLQGANGNTTAFDVSGLADGATKLVATQTDAAGNAGPATPIVPSTKDTVAPVLTGPTVTPTTVNGTQKTITAAGSVASGATPTAAENDPVVITVTDGKTTLTATATPSGGSFSVVVDVSGLLDGTLTAAAVATDPAGNPSNTGTATATKDTAPAAAPNPFAVPAYVNGTNKAAVPFSGTAEPGSTVIVTVSDTSNPVKTVSKTVAANATTGAFSSTIDLTSLADGTVSWSATVNDKAGNVGTAAATATSVKDVVAPSAPSTFTVPAYVNKATAPSTTVTGVAEAGSTVVITATDSARPTAATLTKTVQAGSSDGTFAATFDLSGLADGAISWTATAMDKAGNTGTANSQSSTKDTAAPAAPASPTATPTTVTGNGGLTITGSVGAGDTDTTETATCVLDDGMGHTVRATSVVTQGTPSNTYSCSFTSTALVPLTDGTITASVTLSDVAGNVSTPTTTTFQKDTTHIALVSSSPADKGVVQSPVTIAVTFNEVLSTSGTGTTSTISVTNKAGSDLAGTTSFSSDRRTILFTPPNGAPLTEAGNPYKVTVVAYDSRDTTDKVTTTTTFSVDNTAPAVPTITTVPNPVYSGNQTAVNASGSTSEAGATILVTFSSGSASVMATTTSDVNNAWTVTADLTSLPDGTVSVTATAADPAGNVSGKSAAKTVTKDVLSPTATSSNPKAGTTVQPPKTVSITFGEPLDQSASRSSISLGTTTGTSTVSGSTVTFAPDATLPDGTYTANASVFDVAGNMGSASVTFTVDGTGPTTTNLAASPTSSVKQTTTVTGSVESGASVTVTATLGSSTKTTTATAANGAFTAGLDLTGFPDGTVSVTATATDTLTNKGPVATTSAARDTTAPSVTGLQATPANAANNSTTVSGSAGEPGDSVVITVTDVNKKSVSATATTTGTGSFSSTVTTSSLADGALTLTATASDTAAAGANTGPPATTTTSKDTVGAAITKLAATNTSTATPSTSVTGTTENGATVALSATDGTTTVTGTGTVASDGTFTGSLNLSPLTDGQVTVTATATDAAGNAGTAVSVTVTKDATAPGVSGLSATATTASKATTTVTGTRSETSSLVITATDGAGKSVSATLPAGSGAFSVDLDLSGLGDGTITVTAVATDTAGNTGSAMTMTTKDASAPTVSGLTATATNATTTATTVTGTRAKTSSLVITATDGTKTVSSTVDSGSAGFSTTLDLSSLADGTITVTATATDASGNTASAMTTTTKDAGAPAVTGLSATDATVASAVSTVTGTRSKTSSVALAATDGTTTVTGSVPSGSGGFSATLDLSTLKDGAITVTAVPTDGAGNVGGTATASASKDTVAPAVTDLAATRTTSSTSSSRVTGTRSETSSVALSASDGTTTVTATVASGEAGFSATLDLSSLNDGPITVTATPTDKVGNVGSAVTATTRKDTLAPTVTSLGATATSANTPSSTVSGTRSETSTVAVTATDGKSTVSATVPAGTGSFSTPLDLSTLADGSITVTATPTDTVGNTGAPVTTTTSKDATPPAVTGLAATASSTSTPASTVTGTRSETSMVALTATDGTKTVTGSVPAGSGTFSATLDLSSLKDGSITVTAVPTDTAGNVGATATATTTKSSISPTGAPSTPTATAGDTTATVSFSAPSSTGGSAVTGYRIVSTPAAVNKNVTTTTVTVSGLTNSTAYTFVVYAENAAGESAPSAPSNSVTPHGTSTLTLVSPATSTSGSAFNLTGTVSRTDKAAALGKVTITVRTDDGKTATVGTAQPSSTGAYTLRTAPTVNGTYTAKYAGDSHVTGATSATRRTIVNVLIKVSAPGTRGAHTVAYVVKGSVSPNQSKVNHVVALQQILPGNKLKTVGSAKIAANGTYTVTVKLAKGNYTLLVSLGATPGNGAGQSPHFTTTRT